MNRIFAIIKNPLKLTNAIRHRIDRIRGKAWCDKLAINNEEAIKKIVGRTDYVSFYEKFKNEVAQARKKQEKCPVKMGGAGNLELLYQLCEHVSATKVVETGVAYGWSSLAILLSIKDREGSLLISIDLPYSQETAPYAGCIIPDELKAKWKLIKKSDREVLPEALQILPKIDLCHYDSDKSYKGRMFAYPLLWNALRPGGIFISDDIGDNLAFKKFANNVGIKPIIVKSGKKYVGIIIK